MRLQIVIRHVIGVLSEVDSIYQRPARLLAPLYRGPAAFPYNISSELLI